MSASQPRASSSRHPDVHDGYNRLGMVYEAPGQNKQAADCYRQVIDFLPIDTVRNSLTPPGWSRLDPPSPG
jgi:hypothetical protein